jgi:hypothetical protein
VGGHGGGLKLTLGSAFVACHQPEDDWAVNRKLMLAAPGHR